LGYLGKPLPKRTNIVITRNTNYEVPKGVLVYNSVKDALEKHKDENIFVIGGAGIYKQTIDLADKLYITHVNEEIDGDAFFPKIDSDVWEEVEVKEHENFSFITYLRK